MINKNRNIRLMYAISFLQGMVFYGPIATLYRQAAGISIFQITLIESLSLALCLLLELPWGIVADKIGYKKAMIFCCGLYFISKIVFWKAESFGGFLLERLMLSIVISGLSGLDVSILYLSGGDGQSQRTFGIYNSLNTAGLLIASIVYSVLVGDNYRLAGFLTVFSYGAAALFAVGLQEVKPAKNEIQNSLAGFLGSFRQLKNTDGLWLLLLSVALISESHQTITVFLSQLQYVKCGLSNTAIGGVYFLVTIIGLAGSLSHKMTRIIGERRFGSYLYIGGILACFVLAVTTNAAASVVSVMLLRLSYSLFQPLQTEMQSRQVSTENRATAMSINALLLDSIAIITNLIFGRLAEIQLSYAMLLGVIFCIIGLVLFRLHTRITHVAGL